MQLKEHFIQSKSGNMRTCEDTFFINEHFACVIDGATNVSGTTFDNHTPGQLAASTIKETMSQLEGNESVQEIIILMNQQFQSLYKSLNIIETMEEKAYMRPSASMIIYSVNRRKIWMIGDCQCYLKGKLYQNIKHIDQVFGEARSIILRGEMLTGKALDELMENDIGFELIRPLIRKQYNFQNADPNCTLSYGVVNGFPIPEELIKTIDVSKDVDEIAFASDGYPSITGTLKETEENLERLIHQDPLCIHELMGTKGIKKNNVSFDDRTYMRFSI